MAYRVDSTGNDGKISLIYTSEEVTRADFGGSTGNWNREHIWPKSLGGFGNSGAGSDLHHIRPSDLTINSTRGNLKFGNVNGGNNATGSSLVGGASGGTYNSTYFEPLDNVKGDVARICLYVYVRYGKELSRCNDITNVFESVDVLLEWCMLDPVDEWEMGRNDVVEDIQGNRNVFIDYPEYAWLIFDRDVPEDMPTPSKAERGDTSSLPENDTPDVPKVANSTDVVTAFGITTTAVGIIVCAWVFRRKKG
jgi:endonuclease I